MRQKASVYVIQTIIDELGNSTKEEVLDRRVVISEIMPLTDEEKVRLNGNKHEITCKTYSYNMFSYNELVVVGKEKYRIKEILSFPNGVHNLLMKREG